MQVRQDHGSFHFPFQRTRVSLWHTRCSKTTGWSKTGRKSPRWESHQGYDWVGQRAQKQIFWKWDYFVQTGAGNNQMFIFEPLIKNLPTVQQDVFLRLSETEFSVCHSIFWIWNVSLEIIILFITRRHFLLMTYTFLCPRNNAGFSMINHQSCI